MTNFILLSKISGGMIGFLAQENTALLIISFYEIKILQIYSDN